MSTTDHILAACRATGIVPLEQFTTPARPQRLSALAALPGLDMSVPGVPGPDMSGSEPAAALAPALEALGRDPDQALWLHQAQSLGAIASGHNLVLATGTASGKSLVFQAAILASLVAGTCTHLVFYPQKALAADQKHRWAAALEQAGLAPSLVAEINGDIPADRREQALNEARILLVTPDVIHAWLMRSLAAPAVRQFLARLRFVVIDEAHALEGPFGSSTAFLMRRLLLACAECNPDRPPQFIAATATIANPQTHLEALTGQPFTCIGEASNGAPRAEKTLVHVEAARQAGAREAQVASLATTLTHCIGSDAFIVFVDSRQGVERITRRIADPAVLPYRSGYEAYDRHKIEQALRAGRLRGVIATSALELGIDIPQFVIGINVGLPMSRKAFHQRIGRVGRASAGLFIVMAPASTFTSIGTTFAEYHDAAVEPSHLYLENRFIQYAQARCLVDETSHPLDTGTLPGNWPQGFENAIAIARPGGRRPAELDQIAMAGGDCPHLNYPLRQIASENLELRLAGSHGDRVGTIASHQAIREAYPGATYYHLQRPFKVIEWRLNSYERSIRLRAVRDAEPTQPIMRQWVNGSFDPAELLDGQLWQGANGACAEASLQVVEAVEGYRSGSSPQLYNHLAATNPRLRRQQRDFQTTGILLQIAEPWFAGTSAEQVATRKALASALAELLWRERSIAPAEIAWAARNVAVCGSHGPRSGEDTIAIYDNIRGGLRLSAPLPGLLAAFAARLQRAADIAGDAALVDAATADRFAHWVSSLQAATPAAASTIVVPPGQRLIFSPGSTVSFRRQGHTYERRIIAPSLIATPDGDELFYRYESEDGVAAWVAHDAVEPLGQQWSRAFWNPATNAISSCA